MLLGGGGVERGQGRERGGKEREIEGVIKRRRERDGGRG